MALQLLSDQIVIANNILAFNSSGIWRDPYRPPLPTLRYNCMYNTNGNYLNVTPGVSDIMQDPGFVNHSSGDYHVRHISVCINVGDPTGSYDGQTDMDGESRLRYGRVDMGADEVYPIAGDFEPDEDVDATDLGFFADYWLANCAEPEWCEGVDINISSEVKLEDFALLANHLAGRCSLIKFQPSGHETY